MPIFETPITPAPFDPIYTSIMNNQWPDPLWIPEPSDNALLILGVCILFVFLIASKSGNQPPSNPRK